MSREKKGAASTVWEQETHTGDTSGHGYGIAEPWNHPVPALPVCSERDRLERLYGIPPLP